MSAFFLYRKGGSRSRGLDRLRYYFFTGSTQFIQLLHLVLPALFPVPADRPAAHLLLRRKFHSASVRARTIYGRGARRRFCRSKFLLRFARRPFRGVCGAGQSFTCGCFHAINSGFGCRCFFVLVLVRLCQLLAILVRKLTTNRARSFGTCAAFGRAVFFTDIGWFFSNVYKIIPPVNLNCKVASGKIIGKIVLWWLFK